MPPSNKAIRERITGELERFERLARAVSSDKRPEVMRYVVDCDRQSVPALMDRDTAVETAVFVEQITGKRSHVRASSIALIASVPGCGVLSGYVSDEDPQHFADADSFAGEMPDDIAALFTPEIDARMAELL